MSNSLKKEPVEYKIKRYLLFRFDYYQKDGGWDNLVDSYDSLEEVPKESPYSDCCQIVDLVTGEIIDF